MGLAATKVKQRFGRDPRNTHWSNDSNKFGTKYLEKHGWKSGDGLGLVQHATTSHVKVNVKDDRVGLGSKLAKKHKNADMIDDIVGLDVFQRILGKLNGQEDMINTELERQRKVKIIDGKWGISFIKADTMTSTWDKELKRFVDVKPEEQPEKVSRKRKRSENGEEKSKRSKKEKKEKSEKKEKKEKKKEKKDKKEKKVKKEKKKEKSEKTEKSEKEKKEKKDKKEKSKKLKKDQHKIVKKSPETADFLTTRLGARAKYIRQKKAATLDTKALNEIFMIAN